MKILVTGATGFIGSQAVKSFIRKGHQVAALSRKPNLQSFDETDHIIHLEGSLDRAPWTAIKKFAPDACLHSAWITTPGVYLKSKKNDLFVTDSLKFLQRLEQIGVSRFIVLGTCIEYDLSGKKPFREEHTPTAPVHRYSKAKARLHEELRQVLSSTSTLIWARIFYPYGSGEASGRLSSLLIKKASVGETMELKNPKNTLDYIHISDVSSALTAILERGSGGVINIGSGQGISVQSLAETIYDQLDCRNLLHLNKTKLVSASISIVADNSKLRAIGWEPLTSINAGLENLIQNLCPDR